MGHLLCARYFPNLLHVATHLTFPTALQRGGGFISTPFQPPA